jgi:hypothetical protein
MKRTLFCLFLTAAMIPSLNAAETISDEESKKIIDGLYKKMEPAYKKYSGIIAVRSSKHKMTDLQTGELKESVESLVKTKFAGNYEAVEIIKYTKNGQELPASKFTERKPIMFYPVFDDKGRERYSISITGIKKVNEIECYILNITPKQITSQHYSGNMYYSRKGLDLIAFEGKPAALETGVKSFKIYTEYKTIKNLPFMIKSQIEIYIHVPVFFPNKKLVINLELTDHELFAN